jgi:hypothetical protein
MKRLLKRRPSPAMIIAIVALVAATAGTSYAAIGLGALSDGAKNKTVGVGKLTYVTTTAGPLIGAAAAVSATCPGGLNVIGGGIKSSNPSASQIDDSHPTSTGWAGHVVGNGNTYTTTAICAKSRVVTGAPPSN